MGMGQGTEILYPRLHCCFVNSVYMCNICGFLQLGERGVGVKC